MIKNNAFTLDSKGEFVVRLLDMKNGIVKYQSEIGLSDVEMAEISAMSRMRFSDGSHR